ncbi:MAG: VCBS repeat-containing protein [Planctomycetaceae bacterium]|nr:VCBS repeat-containing protein [Planctomycetaceae bacterium]
MRRVVFCSVGLLMLWGLIWIFSVARASRRERTAESLLQSGRFKEAIPVVDEIVKRNPQNADFLWMAARAHHGAGQFERALNYLDRIRNDNSPLSLRAREMVGDICLSSVFDLDRANAAYREVLKRNPKDDNARNRLAYIQALAMRDQEFRPLALEMIASGTCDMVHLSLFVLGSERLFAPETIQKYDERHPESQLLQIPKAYQEWTSGDPQAAMKRLVALLARDPLIVDAWNMWAEIAFKENLVEMAESWLSSVPKDLSKKPQIWFWKGWHSQQQGQRDIAIRCFYEAVRRDPNQRMALYQLGQLLTQAGRAGEARPFLDRSEAIRKYEDAVSNAWNSQGVADIRAAAEQAGDLELNWEHLGWTEILANRVSDPRIRQVGVSQLRSRSMNWATVRSVTELPPIPVEEFPLPTEAHRKTTDQASSRDSPKTQIAFVDEATKVGVKFLYHPVGNPDQGLKRMYEVLGAGVSVLDFDRDGWPDLYFPQSSDWPPKQSATILDQLYRNQDGKSFVNVTQQTKLRESGYSHCAVVGDVDNDGYPDIMVTNIGQNRFFRNNGDGTFSEASSQWGGDGRHWSVGGAWTDFDSDGDLDLYVVNYLTGDDVFTRVCDSNGVPHSCHPQVFQPCRDQVFENLGDDTWREVTDQVGIVSEHANGLGVLIFDVDGDFRPDVFVANDVAPNHLYLNRSSDSSPGWTFSEMAATRGVAVNSFGREEASMGMALGDVDGDLFPDVFVTNFYNETNTLYRQISPGLFEDVTRPWGLAAPSRLKLGFGTEFLDADNDGWLDLVVANGHINNYSDDRDYKMETQFFLNRGGTGFEELPASTLGDFFRMPMLARGLAPLDWNGDGAMDFVLTRIDGSACLLTNRTDSGHKSYTIELRGTSSNRDAFGAHVVLETDQRKILRLLGGGGGYMAANQATLHFGLPSNETILNCEVFWPTGHAQEFDIQSGINLIFEFRH